MESPWYWKTIRDVVLTCHPEARRRRRTPKLHAASQRYGSFGVFAPQDDRNLSIALVGKLERRQTERPSPFPPVLVVERDRHRVAGDLEQGEADRLAEWDVGGEERRVAEDDRRHRLRAGAADEE